MAGASAANVGRREGALSTNDIPQCDRFANVRLALVAVRDGSPSTPGLTARQFAYAVQAARILGLAEVDGKKRRVLPVGTAFLRTRNGSAKERELLAGRLREATFFAVVASDLLGKKPPTVDVVTKRIENAVGGPSTSTMRRRAHCLLAWRRQVLPGR